MKKNTLILRFGYIIVIASLTYWIISGMGSRTKNNSNTDTSANTNTYFFTDSSPTENLFARIYYLKPGSTNFSVSDKVNYCFLTKTNEIATIYFPKPEYLCRIQLLDSNGIAIPKTWSGKKIGDHFYDLKTYSWKAVNKKGYNTGGDMLGFHSDGNEKPDMVSSSTDTTEGRVLPPIQEIFKVKNVGDYKLSLQFQVFKLIQKGTNHTFKIVRFQPVQIPVIKKPE